MLIALFTMIFLSGGGQSFAARIEAFDHMAARIEEVISDEKSEVRLKKAAAQMKDATQDFAKQSEKSMVRLGNAVKSTKLSRGALEDVLAQYDQARASYRDRVIASREQMHETLTREQWNKVFGTASNPRVL